MSSITIGQNIRRVRQEKNITQWQLSKALGLTTATILLIERGSKKCDDEMAKSFAEALGVPVSRIING